MKRPTPPYRSLTENPKWVKLQCERCGVDFWLEPGKVGKGFRYCTSTCRHEPPLVRLLKNVTTNEQGCLLFAGALNSDGYGNIKYEGEQWRAHRLSWHLQRGPIPAGLDVLHTCKKCRACVNIDHLYLGTVQDNTADRMEQGHQAMGETHGNAELTVEQVIAVKKLKGTMTLAQAQEQTGIPWKNVHNIWSGATWKHVDVPPPT